jgi:hypothetical protein
MFGRGKYSDTFDILWTGTITDSFRWSGNFSLCQIEVIRLWILECNVSPPNLTKTWALIYYKESDKIAKHIQWLVKLKQSPPPKITCTSHTSAF